MKRMSAALVVTLLALASCGGGGLGTTAGGAIVVFAAASLTEPFTQIGEAFEHANPETPVRFNFGPSDGLATGITEGGAADVFASASAKPMDRVALTPGVADRAVFARNRLVVIVPREGSASITTLRDIVRPGLTIALAAPGVPVGDYARRMLGKAGLTLRSTPSNEVDVKGVVQKVVLGEADAGIVYATDVTRAVASNVRMISVPGAVNVSASYSIAVVSGTHHTLEAEAFVRYVLGDGQTLLAAAGFLSPL